MAVLRRHRAARLPLGSRDPARGFQPETGDFAAPARAVLDHRSLPLTVAYPYVAGPVYAPPLPPTGGTGFYLGERPGASFT